MEKGYNLNQVSDILGIKVRTARYWVKCGKIKAHKIAGTKRWIVMQDELDRLLNFQDDGDVNSDQ